MHNWHCFLLLSLRVSGFWAFSKHFPGLHNKFCGEQSPSILCWFFGLPLEASSTFLLFVHQNCNTNDKNHSNKNIGTKSSDQSQDIFLYICLVLVDALLQLYEMNVAIKPQPNCIFHLNDLLTDILIGFKPTIA